MMHWFSGGLGWSGWLVMTLTMVAFWALVVYAVVALTRSDRPSNGNADDEDPVRILEQRFARGEIDEDEYLSRHSVLGASNR